MKKGQIFWGTFFITLGGFFLYQQIFDVSLNYGWFVKFWPLILILLGLGFVIKHKPSMLAIIAVAGISAGLIVFGMINHTSRMITTYSGHDNLNVINYEEPYDSAMERVSFNFEGGARSFYFGSQHQNLFTIKSGEIDDKFKISTKRSTNDLDVDVQLDQDFFDFLPWGDEPKGIAVLLNTDPYYDLRFQMGAASALFDLKDINVDHAEFEFGAATFDISFGLPEKNTYAEFSTGASSLTIHVPYEAGVEIVGDMALGNFDFTDFERIDDQIYRTENYDTVSSKIHLKIDGGLVSVDVLRY